MHGVWVQWSSHAKERGMFRVQFGMTGTSGFFSGMIVTQMG